MGSNANVTGSADFRSVAVLHGAALGDFILSLSIPGALRQKLPTAAITLIARSEFAALAEPTAVFTSTYDINAPGFHTLFAETGAVEASWRERLSRFDLVVNLLADADSVLHRRLDDLATTVISIDTTPAADDPRHVTIQWLDRLNSQGLALPSGVPTRVELPAAVRFNARAKLQHHSPTTGRPIVILHPGSGGVAKCWPAHYFENLTVTLAAESVQPIFLIGPAERERFAADVIESFEKLAPLVEIQDLAELARVIAVADAYVGNDAGPTHLAALYGASTIAIFGPTTSTVWAPLGANVTVLEAGSDFTGLDVRRVADEVLRRLADPPISA